MLKPNKRVLGIDYRPSEGKAMSARRAAVEFKEVTPSEFFERESTILGYENPTRALYQAVRELVENALDATDLYGILPNITVVIQQDPTDPERCIVTVEDNGIGIPPDKVPIAFGKPFVTSKFKIRQTRGRLGLGVKGVVLYARKHTNKPVEVYTSPEGSSRVYYYKLTINVRANKPLVYEYGTWRSIADWRGTRVQAIIKCNYGRGRKRVLEYLRRLAVIAPYADIVYIDHEGVKRYPRVTSTLPRIPKEVKPHPKGIELGVFLTLLRETRAPTIKEFLKTTFQKVGEKTALQVLKMAGIDPNRDPKSLTDSEAERLYKALQQAKIPAPSSDALSPLGEEIIKTGLKRMFNPEFVTAVTRKPKTHSEGHPFIVEVGIAYGGSIPPVEKPILLRYANRIPLLYDEREDVAWKAIENFNWKHYDVEFPAPIVVLTHICSTKIPWKGANKEAVPDVDEFREELKLALQEAARRLRRYILEKKREEEIRERITTFIRYIPEVAESLAFILSGDGVTPELVKQYLINALRRRMKGKELAILESQVKKLSSVKILK